MSTEINYPFWVCVRSIGNYQQINNDGTIIDVELDILEGDNEVAISMDVDINRAARVAQMLMEGHLEVCDEDEFIEAYLKAKGILDQKFINNMTSENLKRKLNL